ncbi:hypothetical protein CLAIMM_01773 [Cladophialophora immunda]|nr:hypothetical protein CLAIMM_01773 [Cladophialophora immunda]
MATGDVSPSFDDRTDFENADRGFIGKLHPCVIKNSAGRVVWDNDQYDFLQGECPPTANPKLWRQGQLCSKQGLFKVTDGIYQVRGFDISNMTLVEGKTGVVIIDPLVSVECAAAALDLYRRYRGHREVKGVIYSHSHIDHFGGAPGVLPADEPCAIPIIAPVGFMEEAMSENIYAGPAMRMRAGYMFGSHLVKGPEGQIGTGLGMTTSSGLSVLVTPTVLIQETGEEHVIDGVRIVFQLVPETEAPAEINFYFPDQKAVCISECATHVMHNIITLRGALVRDAKAWSKYLDEAISIFCEQSDVLFAGHHWPTWGRENIVKMVSEQRDLYSYLHDQTVRMMNTGLTGIQIAEKIKLPASLQKAWHIQGFYGSVSHNVKAIYQRYLTWFDGNPAHLWQLPPEEEAKRYIKCFGGTEALVRKAQEYASEGDLRFAATLLDHALFADPTPNVKDALATVFEKLGHGAENATWRNFYLTRAQDLRSVVRDGGGAMSRIPAINSALSIEQWFDCLSVQLDGAAAANENIVIDFQVRDEGRTWRLTLNNGALTNRSRPQGQSFLNAADLSMSLTKKELYDVLRGDLRSIRQRTGDLKLLQRVLALSSVPISHGAATSHL